MYESMYQSPIATVTDNSEIAMAYTNSHIFLVLQISGKMLFSVNIFRFDLAAVFEYNSGLCFSLYSLQNTGYIDRLIPPSKEQ